MARFAALLDACVLVPVVSADTLLRLAEAGLYRPMWSAQILDEVRRALEAVHPELADGRARARVDQMREAFPDASVIGSARSIGLDALPDPNDAHVVMAAVLGRADLIVTNNVKDFPGSVLLPLGLEAQTLDAFLLNQLDLAPRETMATLESQASATLRPQRSVADVLQALGRAGSPGFAQAARGHLWRLVRGLEPRRAAGPD